MNKKILILDTSATMQALFKNKLKKTEFDLQFEKNGIQLIVSMYNTVPDAVIINAKTMNPKSNELVRLIKNVEKIKYIPVAVYATNDFIFEKYFMADCGADVFFHFDEKTLQEEIEKLVELKKDELAMPMKNDIIKTGVSQEVFTLIEKIESEKNVSEGFLNLLSEISDIPAAAIFLNEKDGVSAYYMCANNFTEAEKADFLKVCATDFEEAFPNSNIAKASPEQVQNNYALDEFHSEDVPLSSYQTFFLTTKRGEKFGSIHVVREGSFTSNQLDLLYFAVDSFSMIMEYTIMLKGKLKFERNIRKAFGRFVPEQIIDELVANQESGQAEKMGVGEKRDVAILFSDIRSFTNISERNKPETIVAFLNRYFTIMCTIIKKYGGTVDKFIGDAIMALFGAPVSYEDNARRAVAAAYEMREALASVPLEDLVLPEGMKFDIGIGIHYGDVIVGSIGSNDKTDYSVIGDNVNLASRLEGLTKTYGSKIIVSQSVKDDIKTDEFVYRYLDDVKVKGKAKAVPIYSIDVNLEEFSPAYRDAYSKGLGLYQQGVFNLAHEYFEKALAEYPNDKASKLMLTRCREFIQNPPENWDGAISFTTK